MNRLKKKKPNQKVAVAVINSDADLVNWQVNSTVAHLAAELGVRGGKELLKFNTIETKDGATIPMNIQHAIIIKECEGSNALQELHSAAKDTGLHDAVFTSDILETTNDNKVKALTADKNHSELLYRGVLIFGSKSEVE